MKKQLLISCGILLCAAGLTRAQSTSFHDAFGDLVRPTKTQNDHRLPDAGLDPVRRWNQIALNATGLDHTPVGDDDHLRIFGEQFGPTRASRAMAIVHIAIYDALNTVVGGYQNYIPHPPVPRNTSVHAAVAQGAHDALVYLYPSQKDTFDQLLVDDLASIKDGGAKTRGITLGQEVAAAIIADRTNDGSEIPEPILGMGYNTSDQPGHWRQDPISKVPIALGAFWSQVRPFGLQSASQFRLPAPPDLTSSTYADTYDNVKKLGGDGVISPTVRKPDQTYVGVFWAYDGTPSLCAPPRLYNQVAVQVANTAGLDEVALARLLVEVNVSMADCGIAAWDSKYFWDRWRPITAIRESDPGTGPTGLGDGNAATKGNIYFKPLGGQASNLSGPNFTPPFPAYPSGHATFGGALCQVMRRFFGTDNFTFTFVSDEWNGVTTDNDGATRPLLPETFHSFSEAEDDNGQSRIYLGIHFSYEKTSGIMLGNQIADYDLDHLFLAAK